MDFEKEEYDPEQDTRIKTHIIPILCQVKDNCFHMELSQPINVLSNIITYIDLNLRGAPNKPIFNTVNSIQVFKYQETPTSSIQTVTILPGYYTVDQLFDLCNLRFANKNFTLYIEENRNIHEAAQGHYTPIYGNYVYPQFKISSGYNNIYPTKMESNGASRYIIVPNGTYTDDTYFWTAEKLIAKRWLNNLTTTYNDSAIYYDEQPEIFDVTITQRSRWVKGYFDATRNYIHKIRKSISKKDKNYASKITALIGVNPLITLIIGILLLLIDSITSFKNFIISLLIIFILIYITLMIFTYIIIKKEENKLDIKVSKILLIFYNPFYLLSYIYCLYIAITKKDLGWQEIKHTNNTI